MKRISSERFTIRLTFILALLTLGAVLNIMNAQTFSRSSNTKSIDIEVYTDLITIDGTQVIGGTSKTGSIWLKRLSKKGNYYKSYIGKPHTEKFEGKSVMVRKHRDGSTSYYVIDEVQVDADKLCTGVKFEKLEVN